MTFWRPPQADRVDVVAVELGVILGRGWPLPGVPDTARNRALRDDIRAAVAAMPPGVIPDVPSP
jgi:hypothetical protein